MKKISTQIEALAVKHQQLGNRLTNLKARQERIDRAKETRRLILAGQWMFKLNGGDMTKVGQRLAEAGLLRSARDLQLFGITAPASTESSRQPTK